MLHPGAGEYRLEPGVVDEVDQAVLCCGDVSSSLYHPEFFWAYVGGILDILPALLMYFCLQVGEQVQVGVLVDHRVGHPALEGLFPGFSLLPGYRSVGVQVKLLQVDLSVDVLQQHPVVGSWVLRDQAGYGRGAARCGLCCPG